MRLFKEKKLHIMGPCIVLTMLLKGRMLGGRADVRVALKRS